MDKWYGSTLETEGVPMIDKGIGTAYDLKVFEYAMKPLAEGVAYPTKQQLFDIHWPEIRLRIWSDGLVANTEVPPRVSIGKRRYRIFILCEAKTNKHGIKIELSKTKTLQEIFKVDNKKK